MDSETFKLDKLDAARRQLKCAIKMFFSNEDLVPIHTLTGAAHAVLSDIAKSQDKLVSLKHTIDSLLSEKSLKKEWHDCWHKQQNYLKHADRDVESEYEFSTVQTEIMLFDAVFLFNNLAKEPYKGGLVYIGWFMTKYDFAREVNSEIADVVGQYLGKFDPDDRDLWKEAVRFC